MSSEKPNPPPKYSPIAYYNPKPSSAYSNKPATPAARLAQRCCDIYQTFRLTVNEQTHPKPPKKFLNKPTKKRFSLTKKQRHKKLLYM